jgi:murein DD-endopeptidase MepM/ murein hydrolase activator NlpD
MVFSVYTHLRDIQVMPGDYVDENRVIGRLFNQEEKKKARFSTIHLHLEIRKKMDDMGLASFTSLSRDELDKYCLDPHLFFREHLR